MIRKFFSRSVPIAEQAAAWLVKFESEPVSESDRRKFVAWLKQSPEHIEEFLQLSVLREKVATSTALQAPLGELLEEARNAVIPLQPESSAPHGSMFSLSKPYARSPQLLYAGLGMLMLIIAAFAILIPAEKTYRSEMGEQRSIALEDGSVITLNTLSEVKVHFTDHERVVVLVAGEALFNVSSNDKRLFKVTAGPVLIKVIGTRFNVYRQPKRTTVTVLEGDVDLQPHVAQAEASKDSAIRTVRVSSSEQMVIDENGDMTRQATFNPESVTSWTERKLIFEEEPLVNVVSELNRYNRKTIKVDDPELASRPITGSFQVHDLDLFVAFLKSQTDVKVIEDNGTLHVTSLYTRKKARR